MSFQFLSTHFAQHFTYLLLPSYDAMGLIFPHLFLAAASLFISASTVVLYGLQATAQRLGGLTRRQHSPCALAGFFVLLLSLLPFQPAHALDLRGLTRRQIVSLRWVLLNQLRADQIAQHFDPSMVAELTGEQISHLHVEAMVDFVTYHGQSLLDSQLNYLSHSHWLELLNAHLLDHFTRKALTDFLPRLSQMPLNARQLAAFTPAVIAAMDPSSLKAFLQAYGKTLTPQQLQGLTPSQINALSLDPGWLERKEGKLLVTELVAKMMPSRISRLSPATLSGLAPLPLTAPQIRALKPSQLAVLSEPSQLWPSSPLQTLVKHLSPSQLSQLKPEGVSVLLGPQGLSGAQIKWLTPLQLNQLFASSLKTRATATQIQALSHPQLQALEPLALLTLFRHHAAALRQSQLLSLRPQQLRALLAADDHSQAFDPLSPATRSLLRLRSQTTCAERSASASDPTFGLPAGVTPPARQLYPTLPFVVTQDPAMNAHAEAAKRQWQKRIAKNFLSSEKFYLGADALAAQAVLEREQKERVVHPGTYSVRLETLALDPYAHLHSCDLNQLYPEPIDARQWGQMKLTLTRAPGVDAWTQDLNFIFSSLLGSLSSDSPRLQHTKQVVRKRVKKLLEEAQKRTEQGESGSLTPQPLGDLAVALCQNTRRCLDGFQDGLADLEKGCFQAGGVSQHAGEFISRVLSDYKMEFIKRHGQLDDRNQEHQTTSPQILRQRMLYALNLPGAEADIRHPEFGSPDHPHLGPEAVMTHFLRGGAVQLHPSWPTVTFEPFDVQKMIELLQAARNRGLVSLDGHTRQPGPALTHRMLTEFALQDPLLQQTFEDFLSDPRAANDYFANPSDCENAGNFRLKDTFWLYLLEKYSYIERH